MVFFPHQAVVRIVNSGKCTPRLPQHSLTQKFPGISSVLHPTAPRFQQFHLTGKVCAHVVPRGTGLGASLSGKPEKRWLQVAAADTFGLTVGGIAPSPGTMTKSTK